MERAFSCPIEEEDLPYFTRWAVKLLRRAW